MFTWITCVPVGMCSLVACAHGGNGMMFHRFDCLNQAIFQSDVAFDILNIGGEFTVTDEETEWLAEGRQSILCAD